MNSDAGVVAPINNVHGRLAGPDLDGESRVLPRKLRKDSCQRHLEHEAWSIYSQHPRHFAAFRGQSFDCLVYVDKCWFDAGNKSRPRLCQRNAPRRAREQWDCESVLYFAHGVTDRRRTYAEFSCSGREAPVASHTNNDRQKAQKIPVHSCIISHNVCDFKALIEHCLRIHILGRGK